MGACSGYDKPLPNAFGYNDGDDFEGGHEAKPVVELEMSSLSAEIRRKPFWWTKFRDPEVLPKWRAEALAQADQMEESHVEYVLKELDGYANLRDEETGAEVSCYDRIWQSDRLVPDALRKRLISAISKLEDVPEHEKDWHPRSNEQALNLVHPSLYPIVYGRTLSYPEDSADRDASKLEILPPPPPESLGMDSWRQLGAYFTSKKFQWLPTDFKVSDDSKAVKSDGYINSLHPIEHAALHEVVEDLIAAYIPLFERVLTDSIPSNDALPERTTNRYHYEDESYPERPRVENFAGDLRLYYEKEREWDENRPIVVPEVRQGGYQPGSLEARNIYYKLGGRTIQVIVKLANIHLTPEKPSYAGGSWHIEGMKNERIVVSGIYYYDEDNITESRLAFRTAVLNPARNDDDEMPRYEEEDATGWGFIWGINRYDPCVNDLGSVVTSQNRCIAFPNTYQHCVSPFELVDKSKPGHRKIVALFLVDPAVHRPSTKAVPPQQKEWRARAITSNPILRAAFNKLSPEVIDYINSLAEGVMTRQEAEKYRLELMDERTYFVLKTIRSGLVLLSRSANTECHQGT